MEFLLQPLTLLTFLPLVGVLAILFINSEQKAAIRWTAFPSVAPISSSGTSPGTTTGTRWPTTVLRGLM